MSAIKVSRPYLWLQIIVVRREQKRARPVTRCIVGVFGEDILRVAPKALSQSSAEGQAQGVSAKECRRCDLLNVREVWIPAQARSTVLFRLPGANASASRGARSPRLSSVFCRSYRSPNVRLRLGNTRIVSCANPLVCCSR